ncbi:MAG: rhodanese-like domain-containing protein [Rhodoferax sp.]
MKKLFAMLALAGAALAVQAREVLIDVRTPQEYAQDHIAGAINIDHSLIGQEIAAAKVAKDDTVLLYCRSGRRSAAAQETLKKMGFTRVENYGGIDEARQRLGKR